MNQLEAMRTYVRVLERGVAPLIESINRYIGRTQLMQLSRWRFF